MAPHSRSHSPHVSVSLTLQRQEDLSGKLLFCGPGLSHCIAGIHIKQARTSTQASSMQNKEKPSNYPDDH